MAETSLINAAALLMDRGAPDGIALVHGKRNLSRMALRASVANAAAAWQDCGVAPGELVQLHLRPGIEQAVALLGAIWVGALPISLGRAGVAFTGQPWDAQAPCRFILAMDRAGFASRCRDSVLTLGEWQACCAGVQAIPPHRMVPHAPACWTEPRTLDGGGARILTHSFAMAKGPAPVPQPEATAVSTVSGMLKVLRRGGTAELCAPPRAPARSRAAAEYAR